MKLKNFWLNNQIIEELLAVHRVNTIFDWLNHDNLTCQDSWSSKCLNSDILYAELIEGLVLQTLSAFSVISQYRFEHYKSNSNYINLRLWWWLLKGVLSLSTTKKTPPYPPTSTYTTCTINSKPTTIPTGQKNNPPKNSKKAFSKPLSVINKKKLRHKISPTFSKKYVKTT